jgi:hypothetical protein
MNTTETNYLEASRIKRQAQLIEKLEWVATSDLEPKAKAKAIEILKRELGMIWS